MHAAAILTATIEPLMTKDTAQHFEDTLFAILREHVEGVSEYELIRALHDCATIEFSAPAFEDTPALFRAHFLLFHALYALRERLWREARAQLVISPLRIHLLPYAERSSSEIAERDPLRDYYMDLDNLERTNADELDELLGAFWVRLHAGEHRQEALETLGLEDPVDEATIRARYRELAMAHHPDRGGETQRLQAINAAMETLVVRRRRR